MTEIDFRRDLLPLKDKIYRLGLRITLNAQEAEDLTQDTLIRLWTGRDKLGAVESLEAYSLTIVRNMALDRIARRENQNVSVDDSGTDAPDSARTPDEQLIHDERLSRVHEIFNDLPERQRTALQLRDIEGLTYTEAAQAMGITEDLFRVTLHRARKAVKARYDKLDNYGL